MRGGRREDTVRFYADYKLKNVKVVVKIKIVNSICHNAFASKHFW